jgi:hypothetical protein
VITRNIRDFVNRDWAEARASKDAYWGDRIARLGPLEAFRIAEELRQQMRLNDPSWPDDASRRQDVLDHVRFAERLRRAGSARRG